MATPETRRQLLAAVAACDDKKGEDTRILELDPADSGLADYFLITSASNDRQVLTIADEIEFRLKRDFGIYPASVEGRRQAEWILLDYVDLVIHVFLAEKRAFYDIERLRKSARSLTPGEIDAGLRTELAARTRAVRGKSTAVAAKKSSPAPQAKTSSPKSSKGDSSVTAKSTGKAAKKAALKPSSKTAKGVVAPASPAPSKSASAKKSSAASAGAKPPITKNISTPVVGVVAPDLGAKPPIVKCEAPEESGSVSLAAGASKTKKPAKKAAKKAAKAKK